MRTVFLAIAFLATAAPAWAKALTGPPSHDIWKPLWTLPPMGEHSGKASGSPDDCYSL
jgi:hypothetical protein